MLKHAILHVSGIPCTNIQCLQVWESEGWVAIWQVHRIQQNGDLAHWQIGVVTAGERKTCPICNATQRLPRLFDRASALAEVATFKNGHQQTPGYFCRLDCSKGNVIPITDEILDKKE